MDSITFLLLSMDENREQLLASDTDPLKPLMRMLSTLACFTIYSNRNQMNDIQLTTEQIKLVNYLDEFFMPVKEASAGQVFYTTADTFRKLQSLWPTDAYNTEDVLTVLLYKDYNRINSSGDKVFGLCSLKSRLQKVYN